ncbi:hypothetical protein [Citrobacter werkmanii]|uniref:hypothetical protein n=1 Tax=Citrobacter werkmanii TaxID=67827 RepID=UPI0037C88A1B
MNKSLLAVSVGAFQKGEIQSKAPFGMATIAGRHLVTQKREEKALLESAAAAEAEAEAQRQAQAEEEEKALLEAARLEEEQRNAATEENLSNRFHTLLLEAADQSERAQAAAAVLDWAQGGDASAEAFDELAIGLAGIDDTTVELSDDQIDEYNRWLELLATAAISLGADQDSVVTMIDDNDSDAAQAVMDAVTGSGDEDQAIADFSVTGGDDGAMMESAMLEASVKVVRGGVVKIVKKRPHKMRISSAQKAALKKARLKAQTATAKIARAKSMKIRKKRGL